MTWHTWMRVVKVGERGVDEAGRHAAGLQQIPRSGRWPGGGGDLPVPVAVDHGDNPVDQVAEPVGEFGGTPDEVPDVYRDRSPLSRASACQTPLLLIVGESDMCCHPIESEQFYRVLKSHDVPARMLRLPGSPHGGSHTGPVPARVAQNQALLDWFNRYLAPAAM